MPYVGRFIPSIGPHEISRGRWLGTGPGGGLIQTPTRPFAPRIVWLDEPASHDVTLVGGKAAGLGRLAPSEWVPPGFSLTARAGGVGSEGVVPRELYAQVTAAYKSLGDRLGMEAPPVAVRSSAVDEDGGDTSFAGQHETYLNVVGAEAVAEATWRSFLSARAPHVDAYRRSRGLVSGDVRVAVLVQAFIKADVSAVMFTADPVTGDPSKVVINAAWGLGESLVGGAITPDTYTIRKTGPSVVSSQVAEKKRMTVAMQGYTREVDVPAFLRIKAALTDVQAVMMAQVGMTLEAMYGRPVDVEAAYSRGKLYVLQCRPITTLGESSFSQLRKSA